MCKTDSPGRKKKEYQIQGLNGVQMQGLLGEHGVIKYS